VLRREQKLLCHPDDLEYLSRFNVTVTCNNGRSQTWTEWIEPLTVHARHPNGLIEGCQLFDNATDPQQQNATSRMRFRVSDLAAPDYVLIQSSDDYHYRQVLGHMHPNEPLTKYRKSFFFDAGANYFNTSTVWFTCAYLQVRHRIGCHICVF
jgi:hypothetical protein